MTIRSGNFAKSFLIIEINRESARPLNYSPLPPRHIFQSCELEMDISEKIARRDGTLREKKGVR